MAKRSVAKLSVAKLSSSSNTATSLQGGSRAPEESDEIWAKAFWREEPASILVCDDTGQLMVQVTAEITAQTPARTSAGVDGSEDGSDEPSGMASAGTFDEVTLPQDPGNEQADFAQVCTALGKRNLVPIGCGTCTYWQRTATVHNVVREVRPAPGECQFRYSTSHGEIAGSNTYTNAPRVGLNQSTPGRDFTGRAALSKELRPQSPFALFCSHWQAKGTVNKSGAHSGQANGEQAAGSDDKPDSLPPKQKPEELDFGSAPNRDVNLASSSREKESWLLRVGRWFGLDRSQAQTEQSASNKSSGERGPYSVAHLDRSGVGAGTEPCLGCNGRIANLGALIVETEDGDKQTFSVWRCRLCGSTYLNSWVDRWERLDNLETEEHLYRIAPSEAVELLTYIHGIDGGDHPRARGQRTDEREWLEAFIQGRSALSHQIRHGR